MVWLLPGDTTERRLTEKPEAEQETAEQEKTV